MKFYDIFFELIVVLSSNKRKDPFLSEETEPKRRRNFLKSNENISNEIFITQNSNDIVSGETNALSLFDHVSIDYKTISDDYFEEFKPLLLEEYVYKNIYFENDFSDKMINFSCVKTNEEKNEQTLNSNDNSEQQIEKYDLHNNIQSFLETSVTKERDQNPNNLPISTSSTSNSKANLVNFLHYEKYEKSLDKDDVLFGINNYLNDLLTMLSEEKIKSLEKELKTRNNAAKHSFNPNIYTIEIENFFTKKLGHNFYPYIEVLESRFLMRYSYFCRFLFETQEFYLTYAIIFPGEERYKDLIINFHKSYIKSSYIKRFFQKKINCNRNFNAKKSYHNINEMILLFNEFVKEYFKTIQTMKTKMYKSYTTTIKKMFFHKNNKEMAKKLLFWINDLFNNEVNIILMLLFPELRFLIENIKINKNLRHVYKRIHCFLSLVVYKYTYMLPYIEKEFRLYYNGFKLTDSKIINMFIFEVRCFFYIFSSDLLNDEKELKSICLNTFLSFIRLYDPEYMEMFLLNEHLVFENYLNISELIEIDDCSKKQGSPKNIFLADKNQVCLKGITKQLFDQQYFLLNEEEKLKKLYNLIQKNELNKDEFCYKNMNTIENITIKMFTIFNKLK